MASPILFYAEDMRQLALDLLQSSRGSLEEGHVTWDQFNDGFPNLRIHEAPQLRGRDVYFLISINSTSSFFEQTCCIHAIPRYAPRRFTIILPFFPTGTMEREEEEGQVATAKVLARVLSLTPLSRGGPAELIIFDIHALHERFYFGDNVIPVLRSAVPLLKDALRAAFPDKLPTIAFPDEGAYKRFHTMFDGFETIFCVKVREGDSRVVKVKEGTAEGRAVVIVDDLIMTGGTLIACKDALKALGAISVSAYATHGVFPKSSWKKFLTAGFEKIYITNSCGKTASELMGTAPFQIISLVPVLLPLLC